MTGLKVAAAAWLATAGGVGAWQAVVTIYSEFLGLYGIAAVLAALATIVTSLGILGVAARRLLQWVSRAKRAVTTVLTLDEKFDSHRTESRRHWDTTNERLDSGSARMSRIEAALDVLAQSERAAVRGAVDALTAPQQPRPARRTDPTERTGWRE